MPAYPRYTITAVNPYDDNAGEDGVDSRNPSWCVCFLRFKEPAANFISKKSDPVDTFAPLVVENDCVAVTISRPKGNFAKTASLTMRIGQIYYQNACAPGDWVFIWMSDQQEKIDKIVELLQAQSVSPTLNDWKSGLKFVGRVLNLNTTDTISADGTRTLYQSIDCQAFLEFSSSIFYTFVAKSLYGWEDGTVNGSAANALISKQLGTALEHIGGSFLNYMTILGNANRTPDKVIALMLIFCLGVDSDKNPIELSGAAGVISDGIKVPGYVAGILGKSQADKKGNHRFLWEVMQYYGGLQRYGNGSDPKVFAPIMGPVKGFTDLLWSESQEPEEDKQVIKISKIPCKGYIPEVYPPLWDNKSLWEVMSQFLNPCVNEMFTSLRLDSRGRIMPSITVREIPLGTTLFNRINPPSQGPFAAAPTNDPVSFGPNPDNPNPKSSTDDTSSIMNMYGMGQGTDAPSDTTVYVPDTEHRAMYVNLPRWIIDESVVLAVNTSTNEGKRINFTQVWGKYSTQTFTTQQLSTQQLVASQFERGNYVREPRDMSCHGLRADVSETEFDWIDNTGGSTASFWARMRADWYWNGQLKLFGNITTRGIVEPVSEGDNLECRGILFHIEGLEFHGVITPDGYKQFTTVFHVAHGVVATSLDVQSDKDANHVPMYTHQVGSHAGHRGDFANYVPGVTNIENTFGHKKNRNKDGDQVSEDNLKS